MGRLFWHGIFDYTFNVCAPCYVYLGIAEASYIPTIQASLARLLCAAAPPGASARENRRQCLKVT